MDIQQLLQDFKTGKTSEKFILNKLKNLPFQDLNFAKIDYHRHLRKGFEEVVFCQNKTTEQILKVVGHMSKNNSNILLTRVKEDTAKAVIKRFKSTEYNKIARTIVIRNKKGQKKIQNKGQNKTQNDGKILILTAGTSDIPVAEEAKVTAELMGNNVEIINDIGVAGIHRILKNLDKFEEPNVIIAVAGMEGAMPSVICGLTSKPIIAVPTSVGYGSNFKGLSALLSMLNSCCPGIVVVNIDNGFGAGYFASLINK